MKLKKNFIITLLATVLMFAFTITASASVIDDLTKALNDAGISDTGLIVEHLQKVQINTTTESKIKANIDVVQSKLNGVTDISTVSDADMVTIANAMVDSAKLLEMDIKFVDKNNNEINLSNAITNGLQIQLTDSNGNVLAAIDANTDDLNNIASVADALKVAAEKAQVISTTSFIAESGAKLPNTSTPYGNIAVVGGLFLLIGVGSLVFAKKTMNN
jgi:LPXTG-motif cell wall-anchored protein